MNYTSKNKTWFDESGTPVQFSRLTPIEKLQERKSAMIKKKATSLHTKLKEFKDEITLVCIDIYTRFMLSKNNVGKPPKGNFTWFNFDRSVKIEVSINEAIKFDDMTIQACKDKLDEFLTNNIESKNAFVKQIVMDAFETTKGNLDTGKVMSLLKHKKRINDPLFNEAMDLLEESIRRPSSKKYFMVSVKDELGDYQKIDLNFSSIK